MKKKSFTLDKENTIREFNSRKPLFEELQTTANLILRKKLKEADIKIHSIPSRLKDVDSFCGKIERFQIENPFENIKDVVGLRVICLFLSDISKIGDIIRKNFTVITEDNKVDDSKLASFGYLSVHFIVKLGDAYENTVYSDIKDLPFEIQVRTIAMDAWANISHYLDYKTDQDIPKELKKDFYALSGMFYVADKHFQLFFEQREEKQDEILDVFERGTKRDIFSQPINLDTFTAYLKSKFPKRKKSGAQAISILANELLESGYKTIGDIENLINRGMEAFIKYEKEFPPGSGEFSNIGVVRIIAEISDENYLQLLAGRIANEFRTKDEYIEHWNKTYEPYRKFLKKV
jgi:putative GTP pyrophosphokinase